MCSGSIAVLWSAGSEEACLPSTLAAWLDEVSTSGAWQHPAHLPTVAAWLQALASLSAQPLACASVTRPVHTALVSFLDSIARTSNTADPSPLPGPVAALATNTAALARAAPLGAAALCAAAPRTQQLVARAALNDLSTALDAALATPSAERAAAGSLEALAAIDEAWGAAETALAHLSVLAETAAVHKWLIVHGVDAMLVDALVRAPVLRCLHDDGEPLSRGVIRAAGLLRTRLRWPASARLLFSLGQASSLEVATSAMLALLRCLFRGGASHPRCAPGFVWPFVWSVSRRLSLQRFCPSVWPQQLCLCLVLHVKSRERCRLCELAAVEDEKLLLALLVHPWLGDPTSEAALTALLGVQEPLSLVATPLRTLLGEPPSAQLPLRVPEATSADDAALPNLAGPLRWVHDASIAAAARPPAHMLSHSTSLPNDRMRSGAAALARMPSVGSATTTSCVLRVIQADPGMRSRHEWWRAAAAALWTDVLAGHAAHGLTEQGVAPSELDVALLLQRAVLVAMVRFFGYRSIGDVVQPVTTGQ